MVKKTGRTANCGPVEAQFRLNEARNFLALAEIADTENTSVSNAVLAGIAASDAACCTALGKMSRGQDHQQAISLVGEIEPGGDEASKKLARLLALKDAAHYGASPVSGTNRRAAARFTRDLVDFAKSIVAT